MPDSRRVAAGATLDDGAPLDQGMAAGLAQHARVPAHDRVAVHLALDPCVVGDPRPAVDLALDDGPVRDRGLLAYLAMDLGVLGNPGLAEGLRVPVKPAVALLAEVLLCLDVAALGSIGHALDAAQRSPVHPDRVMGKQHVFHRDRSMYLAGDGPASSRQSYYRHA